MVGIMRLMMVAVGILLAFASFWYHAAKKLTLDLAAAWCLVGVVLVVVGAVPLLSRWLERISGWTGMALFSVGGVCLWAAFSVCLTLSRLLTQNQELTMQVSLLRGVQQPEQRNAGTMKKVLFVMNTMETEHVEKALFELWDLLDSRGFSVNLYVLQGRDELAGQFPKRVSVKREMNVVHIDYERGGGMQEMGQDYLAQFQQIYVVSEENKAPFLRLYPDCAEKLCVLPGLIDQDSICRRFREPGGFAEDWDGMRLLTVGRLTHENAFDLAIDAMKLLKDAGYRARWYVLGEGELRESLEKQIDALGLKEDFVLLGETENPCPYYAQADVYVHVARFEGKSIAIQEAQALGCAMVVSGCGGNRLQVTDGEDGLLCDLEPEAIAKTVATLLDSPELRESLGRAAMEKSWPVHQNIGGLLAFLNEGEQRRSS